MAEALKCVYPLSAQKSWCPPPPRLDYKVTGKCPGTLTGTFFQISSNTLLFAALIEIVWYNNISRKSSPHGMT